MIRGTTPDIVLTINGYNLTDKTVYVTISKSGRKLTKTNEDLMITYTGGTSSIAFRLTQEETLAMRIGTASVQVRFISADGTALATDIKTLSIEPVLLEEVIEYAADD